MLNTITLLQDIQDSLDYARDHDAIQKLQNVMHYLTAPRDYAACYSIYGSLEIGEQE